MVNSDGLDIYQYHGTIFSPFFTGYRGFEKRSIKNTIRMSLLSMVEPYQIYYALDKGEVIGFAVVSSGGGGRLSCSTRNDIILGPINICREKRGRGYGTRLIHAVLKDCALHYENAYEFIHEDNLPSIRSAEKNGYILIGRGVYCGLLKNLEVNDTGYLLVYKKHAD